MTRSCCRPPRLGFKPLGRQWFCPECGTEWRVRADRTTLRGKQWADMDASRAELRRALELPDDREDDQ